MIKILLFYMGYIPSQRCGGPVTSMYHFVEMFGDEYDIKVVCKNHDFLVKDKYEGIKEGWNKIGKAKVLYLSDDDFNKRKFRNIIDKAKPDLIYTSSIFLANLTIPLLLISQEKNIPILLAPRGELSSDRIARKAWKKVPYLFFLRLTGILRHTKLQATSETEYNDIKKILKPNKRNVYLVENIPCSVMKKEDTEKTRGQLTIVATSRIQYKNNLIYSINIVNKMKSKVAFDIYGPIEDAGYWNLCKREMRKAPGNVKYAYKGNLPLQEIEKVYLKYDCLLHPTHSENYGHVIVEAFCHDCPVVISKGTTPWDSIEKYNAGFVCELGDDQAFVKRLEYIATMDSEEYKKMVMGTREYAKQLNMEGLKRDYETMIEKAIGSRKLKATS